MIRINLLPEEYRRKAKTPIKQLLGILAAVAVNTSLAAWGAWMFFGIEARITSERSVLQTEMEGLNPQVAYHRALETEARGHKTREATLAQITKSRVNWTQKLDQLIDVVNRGGDGQRHLVWFDDINVSQGGSTNRGGSNAGEVRAAGHSGSGVFAQVANFLEDLESSPFVQDFHPPAAPEGNESLVDETLVPSVVWSFPLSLKLKQPENRK